MRHRPPPVDLTPREVETLRLFANADSMTVVAQEMGLSRQTVKNHFANAYDKLRVVNGRQAFVKLGWLRVPDHMTAGAKPLNGMSDHRGRPAGVGVVRTPAPAVNFCIVDPLPWLALRPAEHA